MRQKKKSIVGQNHQGCAGGEAAMVSAAEAIVGQFIATNTTKNSQWLNDAVRVFNI
jgi:hypothetical protein